MKQYTIIDNLLPTELHTSIKNSFFGSPPTFPWFYNSWKVSYENFHLNNYQFTHMFYNEYSITSEFFPIIKPIVEYLNPESIIRIKANLTTRTESRHVFEYHTDTYSKGLGRKTAIYYVNTNDGATILNNGIEIESIENRLVIFDQNISHAGTTCTNDKIRCLVNFNYIEYQND